MDIGTLIPRHARYRGAHAAIVLDDQRLSYRDLEDRTNRLANALLGLGLRAGDKLAIVLPNCLELLEAYWAAPRIGVVLVPLSPLLRGAGLAVPLRDSDAAAVLSCAELADELQAVRGDVPNVPAGNWILTNAPTASGFRDYAALTSAASPEPPPLASLSGDHPFNIIYSSGTTGQPKGIVHTHDIRAMYCTLFASTFRMTPESVIIHSGSLVFNGAFVTMMPAFYLGATYVLQRKFDAESFIAAVERERATHVMLVPSQIVAMMNAPGFSPDRLKSLEMICTVGAPLHSEHKERLIRMLPASLYELYGLTEGFLTILDRTDYRAKRDSVGAPPALFEMRIVGEDGRDLPPGQAGEIVGRGPVLMPGYYKRPDLTAQAIVDGWLHTGDMGYVDDDGYLYLVDRKKDLIVSGGVNVYPKDIEEVVVRHPAVREVAVFGVPDAKWGEAPLAAVILNRPDAVTATELLTWVNSRVNARYQQLKELVLMDDFPRSTAGKTLKRVLRDPYWASVGRQI